MSKTKITNILAECNLFGLTLSELCEKPGDETVSLLNNKNQTIFSFTLNTNNNKQLDINILGNKKHTYSIEFDTKNLQYFLTTYFSNTEINQINKIPNNIIHEVQKLREKNASSSQIDGTKKVMFFTGEAKWELMHEIENKATFIDFIHFKPLQLATASNSEISQWSSILTNSIITVERRYTESMISYLVAIEYIPVVNLIDATHNFISNNFLNKEYHGIPDDAPIDVLMALLNFNFGRLWDKNHLVNLVYKEPHYAHYYITVLSMLVNEDEHELIFSPLINHPDMHVRDVVAVEALYVRKKEAFYLRVKAKGISDRIINWLKEHNLNA